MKKIAVSFETQGWGELKRTLNSFAKQIESLKEDLNEFARTTERSFQKLSAATGAQAELAAKRLRRFSRQLARPFGNQQKPITSTSYSTVSSSSVTVHQNLPAERAVRLNREFLQEYRAANQELIKEIRELKESQREPADFGGMLGTILSPVLYPIEKTLDGFFEQIGNSLSEDFARGLADQAQKSLGLPAGEVGRDIGASIGDFLFVVFDESTRAVQKVALNKGSLVDNLSEAFGNIFSELVDQFRVRLPITVARAYRRIKINKEALYQVPIQSALSEYERPISDYEKEKINQAKSISIVVGGYNLDPNDFGKDYTAKVLEPVLSGSAVIPVARKNLEKLDPTFKQILDNLLKSALEVSEFRKRIVDFLGGSDLFKSLSAKEKEELLGSADIDLANPEQIIALFERLVQSQEFSIVKSLETIFQGYSLDDILVAAEALKYRRAAPEKPLQIVGFSQGGNEAAGAVELLVRLGFSDVKGVGIGTPLTPLTYTGPAENFLSILGDQDYYFKALKPLLDEIGSDLTKITPGEGLFHALPLYATSPQTLALLQSFLGDRIQIPRKGQYTAQDAAALYYASREGAGLSVIRSILNALGVGEFEGVQKGRYAFSAGDLEGGYTQQIKKRLKKVTNEDVKQYLEDYLKFLDELREEISKVEFARGLGVEYKPTAILESAKKFFPELSLVSAPQQDPAIKALVERQRQEMPNLAAFVKKINQEAPQIQRSFVKMLGGSIPEGAYAFFDEQDFKLRAEEHLGGLIDYVKREFYEKASDAEKALMDQYLDFLTNFQQQIVSAGETSGFDTAVIEQAQRLLGVQLPTELESQLPKDKQFIGDPEKFGAAIKEKYSEYLRGIVKQANATAERQITALVPNVERFTVQELRQLFRQGGIPEELKQKMRAFRQAVRERRIEQARILGEGLLQDLAASRKVAEELARETQGGRPLISATSLRAIKGTLTRYQREILEGSQREIGLVELIGGDPSALKEIARQLGEATAAGFRQGVSGAAGAGEDLAEGAISEAEDRLDISSPSKVFQRIGKWVAAGFRQGIQAGRPEVEQEIGGLVETTGGQFGRLKQLLVEIGGNVLGFLGIFSFADAISKLGLNSLESARKLESLKAVLSGVSSSGAAFRRNLEFARREAKRLGVDLEVSLRNYSQFLGGIRGTAIEGETGEQIFSAFAQATRQYQLDTETTNRVFLALNQMVSKGKISAEELRQQLGEALPGALDALRDSLGVTNEQLQKMLQNGELITVDVLPKFAAQLAAKSENSLAYSLDTADAALARLRNSFLEFSAATGESLLPFQKIAADTGSKLLDLLTQFGGLITQILASAFASWLIGILNYLKPLAVKLGVTNNLLSFFVSLVRASLPSLMAFAGRFLLITAALEATKLAVAAVRNEFSDLEKNADRARARVDRLRMSLKEIGGGRGGQETSFARDDSELRNADFLDPVRRFITGNRRGLAQKQQADFIVAAMKNIQAAQENLAQTRAIENQLEQIKELDKQLAALRTKQLNTPLADSEALAKLREEQNKLLQERQRLLNAASQYSQNLIADAENLNKLRETAEDMLADRRITLPEFESLNQFINLTLKGIESAQERYNSLSRDLSINLDLVSRSLRGINSVLDSLRENQGIQSSRNRLRAIQGALREELGSEALSQAIAQIAQREKIGLIAGIRDGLVALDRQLRDPLLAETIANLESSLREYGVNLDSIAQLQEQLNQEGISQQERTALQLLIRRKELQQELAQLEESLAQESLDFQNRIRDLGRQTAQFLERLTQTLVDLQQQIAQARAQISFGEMKLNLQRVINPLFQTFASNLANGIQGLLDSASQLQEKILGQQAARLQLPFEEISLRRELEDFSRQIRGAALAVEQFRGALQGSPGSATGRIPGSGNVVFPIPGRSLEDTRISSGFGPRRRPVPGASTFHRGVDFAVPAGTPVAATRASRVERIVEMPGGEFAVYTRALAENIEEGFLHINRLLVKVGDVLEPGQRIGQVSGVVSSQSSGAHLDYRIAINGQFVDPVPFLRQMGRGPQSPAGTGSRSLPAGREQRIEEALNFYLSQGLSQQGAAYLVGALLQESGLDPNAVGDQGTARGLAQWRGERQRGMPADFHGQLAFVLTEMNRDPQSRQARVLETLRNPNASVEEVRRALKIYERYGVAGRRYEYGEELLQRLRSSGAGTAVGAAGPSAAAELEALRLVEGQIAARRELLAVQEQLTEQQREQLAIQIESFGNALPEQLRQKYEEVSLSVEEVGLRLQELFAPEFWAPEKRVERATFEVGRQFQAFERDLSAQIKQLEAEIDGLQKLAAQIPNILAVLREQGQTELAKTLENTLAQVQAEIPKYQALLQQLQGLGQQVTVSSQQARELARINAEYENRKRQFDQEQNLISLQLNVQEAYANQLRQQGFEFEANALQKQIEARKIINETTRQTLEIEREIAIIKSQMAYTVDPQQLQYLEAELNNRQQLLATLQQMQQINLENLNRQFKDFGTTLNEVTKNQFADFLTSVVMGTKTIGEAFRDMALGIIAEIARISAQKLAAQLFGGGGGGSGGGFFSWLGGLFGFAYGGTVPNLATGGNPDNLKKYPLDEALRREGPNAVLAVFTPGEEVLSLRTGEAQRYRSLKKALGDNPLKKVLQNFAYGGSVESTLLSTLSVSRNAISLPNITRESSVTTAGKPVVVNMQINTPDANSFRKSQAQIQRELSMGIRRSLQRDS